MNAVTGKIKKNDKDEKTFDLGWKVLAGFLGAGLLWLIVAAASQTSIASAVAKAFNNNTSLGMAASKNVVTSLLRMNVFLLLSAGGFFLIDKLRASKPKEIDKKTFNANLSAIFGILFILLLSIDLWSIDAFYLKRSYVKLDDFYQSDGVINFLKNDPTLFRVATGVSLPQGNDPAPIPTTSLRGHYLTYLFPYYDIESIDVPAVSRIDPYYGSYFITVLMASLGNPGVVNITNLQASLSGASFDFRDLVNLNVRLFQLANVKYIMTDGYPIPQRPDYMVYSMLSNTNLVYTNLVYTNGAYGVNGAPHYIFYVKNTLPRAGFYENYLTVPDNNDALNYIASTDFDIHNIVVVNADVSPAIDNYNNVVPLTALEYKPWYAKFETDTGKPGVVLFNVKYDPSWKAFVDGKPATLYKANYIAQGVFVDAGRHTVEFRFVPDTKPFRVSLLAAIAGLAALIALIVLAATDKKAASSKDGENE